MEGALFVIPNGVNAHETLHRVVIDQLGSDSLHMLNAIHEIHPPRSYAEIAVKYGVSKMTVCRKVRRARAFLRKYDLLPREWE